MRRLRIGTYNVRVGVPVGDAAVSVSHALTHCDVLGLQEWGSPGRMRALEGLDCFDLWAVTKYPDAPPITFRHSRFRHESSARYLVAPGRYVGVVPGRRTVLPNYWATVLRVVDKTVPHRHTTLTFINVHTPADVERHGRYRLGRRAAMHREIVRNLAAIVEAERLISADVFVMGDWNFAHPAAFRRLKSFAAYRLVSCWSGHTVHGTLGSRCVDGIFATRRAAGVRVLGETVSDHRAVIAAYGSEVGA